MTGGIDYRAKAEEWLIGTPDGGRALEALGRALSALEHETHANSTDARAKAQDAALRAQGDFDAVIGITALRRRRMIASARDLPVGSKTDENDLPSLTGNGATATREGRAALRFAMARWAIDASADMTGPMANLLAANLRGVAGGHDGLFTERDPSAGVDPEGGPATILKELTAIHVGYTCGVELISDRIPRTMWDRAAAAHNEKARELGARGLKVPPVTAATIKSWCLRAGAMKVLFNEGWGYGRADRASETVNTRANIRTLGRLP